MEPHLMGLRPRRPGPGVGRVGVSCIVSVHVDCRGRCGRGARRENRRRRPGSAWGPRDSRKVELHTGLGEGPQAHLTWRAHRPGPGSAFVAISEHTRYDTTSRVQVAGQAAALLSALRGRVRARPDPRPG